MGCLKQESEILSKLGFLKHDLNTINRASLYESHENSPHPIDDQRLCYQSELPRSFPWNSLESYLGCTWRIYIDYVTLTLHNVTLTS